ncbi:hypothetical protein ACFX1S_014936 [Malus domestica]
MSSSLVRMKHDKQKVKVPAIPTPPTFHLLCYLGRWILVLLILPCSASAACDRLDRDALLSLPFNTPLNWSASTDCCLWDGVTCDPVEHSRVVRLSLPRRGLSGVVSPSSNNHHCHLNHSKVNKVTQTLLFQVVLLRPRSICKISSKTRPKESTTSAQDDA